MHAAPMDKGVGTMRRKRLAPREIRVRCVVMNTIGDLESGWSPQALLFQWITRRVAATWLPPFFVARPTFLLIAYI